MCTSESDRITFFNKQIQIYAETKLSNIYTCKFECLYGEKAL